jgi:hypothetical protein
VYKLILRPELTHQQCPNFIARVPSFQALERIHLETEYNVKISVDLNLTLRWNHWDMLRRIWAVVAVEIFEQQYCETGDRDSSVDIATGYRLEGPGIESRWRGARFSAHPTSCTMGTEYFLGYCGRGVVRTTHPLLAPRSRKSRAINLHFLCLRVCYGVPFTFTLQWNERDALSIQFITN